jgi:hypothetical protein
MMNPLLSQTISTFLGVAASLGAWAILFHGLRPKLEFSTAISRVLAEEEGGGLAYRVKLRNSSRREIVDIALVAKLRIYGLNSEYPQNWEVAHLPVSFGGELPVISRGTFPIVRIKTTQPDEFTRLRYPAEIRAKAAAGTLTLDDLLALGTASYVQIFGFGSDAFSGTRRHFASPKYTLASISDRRFKRASLELADPASAPALAQPPV